MGYKFRKHIIITSIANLIFITVYFYPLHCQHGYTQASSTIIPEMLAKEKEGKEKEGKELRERYDTSSQILLINTRCSSFLVTY